MITVQDVGERPRDFDLELRNPFSQPGLVWASLESAELPSSTQNLGLRRTDPGGIFALSEKVLGRATRWAVLGDNIIGAMGWASVRFEDQYRAVTAGAAAFIASAMCYLRVSGADAGTALDALSPRKVSGIPIGSARFVLFTTPAGTVDDDAVVVRTGPQEWEISCGGGKRPGWLPSVTQGLDDVTVEESDVFSFNIKGPKRLAAVQSLLTEADAERVAALRDFTYCEVHPLAGGEARVMKTVIGYEVWARADALARVWQQVITERSWIVPCGWELLTVYRLECPTIVFTLYPVDVHSGTTLWEAGYGWMVEQAERAGDGRDYIGRKALLKSREHQRLWLAGLRAPGELAPPPSGREVLSPDGDFLGHVTTAANSPKERRTLAFAHLLPQCRPGQRVLVEGVEWTACSLPFAKA